MKTVYVVIGTCGEYSDHREWPVRAYNNVEAAEELVVKATVRANEIRANATDQTWYYKIDGANEYDPGMQSDYTGTHYYIWEVPYGTGKPRTPAERSGDNRPQGG
jgi:hypothetical protein